MKRRALLALAAIALLASGAVIVGCGETSEGDPTPVTTWPITPASGSPVAQPTSAGEPTPPPDEGPNVIRITARNILFDKEEITATAGEVTIIFDNQDGGQPHNVHFFEGDNSRGESVGDTPIKNGPALDTLVMTLEPGGYYYQCDAHPNMNGILAVAE